MDVFLEPPFCGITGSYSLPDIFRLIDRPFCHLHPGDIIPVQGRRSSLGCLFVRDIWARIFKINGLILVDIGNKLFALVIKGFEKE
jgi:hypothetical protein